MQAFQPSGSSSSCCVSILHTKTGCTNRSPSALFRESSRRCTSGLRPSTRSLYWRQEGQTMFLLEVLRSWLLIYSQHSSQHTRSHLMQWQQ